VQVLVSRQVSEEEPIASAEAQTILLATPSRQQRWRYIDARISEENYKLNCKHFLLLYCK
jgi:hypothetical protein